MNGKSIEPLVADLVNGWMKAYGVPYKLEQEPLNEEIEMALKEYASKNGGSGGNRPDAKVLLRDSKLRTYPILIEYKGYKDKLEKLDADGRVDNKTSKNEPNYKNINSYAVNGAVHYANAILHYTSYTDVIAIGVTGYKTATGKIKPLIGVYYVSKSNLGVGQKVGEYSDLSFLRPDMFDAFSQKVQELSLSTEELEALREKREKEINASLVRLNNDIYTKEKGLSENDRVYLVAATIMATLGVPNKVQPLEKSELKSSEEVGNTDGDIIMRKIAAFLEHKNLPPKKQEMIVKAMATVLEQENINRPTDGESQLKQIFCKIVDDLGIYYKIGLTTDFTGKLFNEMYSWLGYTQDKLNDIVLTPSYVAQLLVKLTRVNKDSYVWDFATGSAGLLVAAMNEMLNDAKETITSPQELMNKELKIKAEQLLGVELISEIYMLAVLNMILMGDGSSNILNENSLTNFKGKYGYGKTDEDFPADAFVLNPPYSEEGNGMVFVEKALSMMHRGYAAIIIQSSAGSGKAKEINKRILRQNRLLASIKMPADLFVGKSSVQTHVYVFKVRDPHHKDYVVQFIDFSNDGYTRSNRKKASVNLRDTDHAKERYQEVADVVRYGGHKRKWIDEKDYYEGHIDPDNGADWNQSAPIDTTPTLDDFKKTVADYLAWEVSNLLKNDATDDTQRKKADALLNEKLQAVQWGEHRYNQLFKIEPIKLKLTKENLETEGKIPVYSSISENNGIIGYTKKSATYITNEEAPFYVVFGDHTRSFNIASTDFCVMDNVKVLKPLQYYTLKQLLFIISSWKNGIEDKGYSRHWSIAKEVNIQLPIKNGEIDFEFMDAYISELEEERISELAAYLKVSSLDNYELSREEEKVLEEFNTLDFKEYRVGDLFEINSSKKIFHAKDVQLSDKKEQGNFPYVVRKTNENGIRGYVKEEHRFLNPKNTLSFAQDTFTVFYQKDYYYTGNKVKVLVPKFEEFNEKLGCFFTGVFQNLLRKLSWGDGSNVQMIKDMKITLPITPSGIDFAYMETLITAVQKLVIKDVVQWADKKIAATKQVVGR